MHSNRIGHSLSRIEKEEMSGFVDYIIITNLLAGLMAYSFLPKKPSIKHNSVKSAQLALFY